MSRNVARLTVVLALWLCLGTTHAQFGQNKIAYESYDWQVYASPHFDVHYYPVIEPFLEEVVSYAESAYVKISEDLDHELRFRVPLVLYKTHGEFQRTNIQLAELPEGVGAFAEPVQYRMVLPIDEPPDRLYALIAHELTHIFEYSLFYEGYLGRALRSRPPLWIMEGLASYLADDETNIDQMVIRDAVVNNILPPVQALDVLSFLTYRYGHAIFEFIEQEYGKEGLRSFLFEFKKVLVTANLERAIKESFGYEIDEFNRRFNRYLRRKYFPILLEKKSPDDYGTEIVERRTRDVFSFAPSLSPSGELVAALSAPNRMELDLVVLSAEDGKIVKNLTKGWTNSYQTLVAEGFDGKRDVSWSPVSDEVAVFARREDKWILLVFNALTGKKVREYVPPGIYQCASPSFSPDGRRVAFEGNRDGVVDIFEVDLDSEQLRNLTQDDFFDANPWYSADASTLLYNRRIGSNWKIFSVDLSDPQKKSQLSFGAQSDLQPAYSRDGKSILFTSDRGEYGVFNLHSLDLTTGDLRQYTDLVGGAFTPEEMAERDGERSMIFTAFYGGTFRIYRMPLRNPELKISAADQLDDTVDAEAFEPQLSLSVDEASKSPYRARWDLDAPSVTVGVADDGTFLAAVGLQFSDLLGNQRLAVSGASVADFQQYQATYLNTKRRSIWGAQVFDYRDYIVNQITGQRFRQQFTQTGALMFYQYPFSRHYRIEAQAGVYDSTQNFPFFDDATGEVRFFSQDDTLGLIGLGLTGDTTRYQSFGPFQGKRFNLTARYGPQISGDVDGDLLEYRLDFRAYKKATRRSVLAWRLGALWNTGDRDPAYGFGGLNQLRGWDYRDFIGSQVAWSNLEFRFPLIDELRFPILALQQIRGFFFADAGMAKFQNDLFYDPELPGFRVDPLGNAVPFKFWDGDRDQLQDGRASYGVGFQLFFLGGLQFNWVWSYRLDHTQYVFDSGTSTFVPADREYGGVRSDFYIQFDF